MAAETALDRLENQLKAAEARAAIAEAEKKEAEAKKAKALAELDAVDAATDAERANEQADADHRKTLAEAAQKEAEANKAADAAKRAMETAAAQSGRDVEKARAETRKAVAEADVAAVKAFLPGAPTLKPLEGKVTTDDKSGVVAEIAAYTLLNGAARQVADKVAVPLANARVLVVTDRQLASSGWPYRAVAQQLTRLQTELAGVLGLLQAADPAPAAEPDEENMVAAIPPVVAALSALPSIVGAVADVAGYFQSDYTITGRAFDLKVEPVVAALAGALAEKGVGSVIDGFHAFADTGILCAYDTLLATRWSVVAARIGLEQHKLGPATAEVEQRKVDLTQRQAALTTLETATPANPAARTTATTAVRTARRKLQEAQAGQGNIQRLVEVAKAAEQRVDALATSLMAVPATGGLPPLGQAAMREAMHGPEPTVTHVLYASVSASGGETQVRHRRFFAPVVRYVGACNISVLLATTDGTIVYAGSHPLVGSLTYKVKDGEIGSLKKTELKEG